MERVQRTRTRGEHVLGGGSFRLLPFLGPAFIAAVAYVDPGNFATNIAGGSQFGYTLVWVVVASSLMAMLVQGLSAKLGVATGRNLAEVCRDEFPRRVTFGLWVQAEIIAMATDLAEFLGAAIGLHLLVGIALLPAAVLTAIASFLILGMQRFGFRPLEGTIVAIVMVIGICYVIELFYAQPDLGLAAQSTPSIPSFAGSSEALLLSVGIIGATVMPHVIWLHSALLQDRIRPANESESRRLMRFTWIDVLIAMTIAGLINVAMLVMAASTFYKSGLHHVESLEVAHKTLVPLLGSAASAIFALALLASGLASSAIGTLSGQVVMQGFVRRRIPIWVRRTITMLPAFIVIAIGASPSRTLVLSQVVLSFGIPFALIPLVYFTRRTRRDGHAHEPPPDDGRGVRRRRDHHQPERVPAPADVRDRLAEIAERVDRRAVHAHLEVHVRAGAEPGAAGVRDRRALVDLLAARDRDARVVAVRASRSRRRGRSSRGSRSRTSSRTRRPCRRRRRGSGVPLGTPMSMPGCSVPQRIPNGLVIGPDTGQMKCGASPGTAGEPSELPESFAASAELAAASACDSPTSSWICFFVAASAFDFADFAPASWPWLETSCARRISSCCARPRITCCSVRTVRRTARVRARADATLCFDAATASATCLSAVAIAPR